MASYFQCFNNILPGWGLLLTHKVLLFVAAILLILQLTTALPVGECQPRSTDFLVVLLRNHPAYSENSDVSTISDNDATGLRHTGELLPDSIYSAGVRFGSKGNCDSSVSGHINQASLCPWHYLVNHDKDRFPEDIVEAHRDIAACPYCTGLYIYGSVAECQKVTFNMPALFKTSSQEGDTGYCVYEFGYQRLSVGYTCAKPMFG